MTDRPTLDDLRAAAAMMRAEGIARLEWGGAVIELGPQPVRAVTAEPRSPEDAKREAERLREREERLQFAATEGFPED